VASDELSASGAKVLALASRESLSKWNDEGEAVGPGYKDKRVTRGAYGMGYPWTL
jgi:hypothetical protein